MTYCTLETDFFKTDSYRKLIIQHWWHSYLLSLISSQIKEISLVKILKWINDSAAASGDKEKLKYLFYFLGISLRQDCQFLRLFLFFTRDRKLLFLIYEGCPETFPNFTIARQSDRAAISGKWRILTATFVSHLTLKSRMLLWPVDFRNKLPSIKHE